MCTKRNSALRLLIMAIICLLTLPMLAQDLVIPWTGDSLNCKVLGKNGQYVTYRVIEEDFLETTFSVPPSMILKIEKGFYAQAGGSPIHDRKDGSTPMIRMLVRGGLGNHLGYAEYDDDQVQSHHDGLKHGLAGGVEFTIETPMMIDVGLSYSIFNTRNETDLISTLDDDTGNEVDIDWIDNMTVQFVGPKIAYLSGLAETGNVLEFNITPGVIFYNNKNQRIDNSTHIGSSLAMQLGVDHDLMLNDQLGIAFGARMLLGSVNKIEIIRGDRRTEAQINRPLSRLDLSIGLVYYSVNKVNKAAAPRF